MENQRTKDNHAESVISSYLDEYYYKFFEGAFIFDRIKDPGQQKKGIDLLAINRINNTKVVIDEKSQVQYMSDGPLPTFSLELSFYARDDHNQHTILLDGWFINTDLETTDYLFVWPKSRKEIKKEDLNKLEKRDIHSLEVMSINKKELQNFIEKETGKSVEDLRAFAREFRTKYDALIKEGKITDKRVVCNFNMEEKKPSDSIYLFYSLALPEKPINIIVKKDILKKLARNHYIVNNDGIWELKYTN